MEKNLEPSASGFQELGIAPKILDVLDRLGFTRPTPIQRQAIPAAIEGKDIMGIAQTGTGKTLAFGIPMIQRLDIHQGQGLILVPTRELALQIDEVLQQMGKNIGLKTVVLIGGAPIYRQIQALRQNPHILIATPGRLTDHLLQGTARLNNVKIIVVDEADRMFDIGFAPQIKQILGWAPKERQTMLFSATMSPEVVRLAAEHLSIPLRIEVAPSGTAASQVEHEVFIIDRDQKMQLLEKILSDYKGTVLIFSRTKHGARKMTTSIRNMGHSAVEIHSDRTLSQRRAALEGFKSGRYRILVATDIAARGIDVVGIEIVINYDLPGTSEDYVHRIGRTGRAGYTGRAISFATPDQRRDLHAIERLIRKALPVKNLPILPPRRTPPTNSMPYHQRKNFDSGRGQKPRFWRR